MSVRRKKRQGGTSICTRSAGGIVPKTDLDRGADQIPPTVVIEAIGTITTTCRLYISNHFRLVFDVRKTCFEIPTPVCRERECECARNPRKGRKGRTQRGSTVGVKSQDRQLEVWPFGASWSVSCNQQGVFCWERNVLGRSSDAKSEALPSRRQPTATQRHHTQREGIGSRKHCTQAHTRAHPKSGRQSTKAGSNVCVLWAAPVCRMSTHSCDEGRLTVAAFAGHFPAVMRGLPRQQRGNRYCFAPKAYFATLATPSRKAVVKTTEAFYFLRAWPGEPPKG